MNIYYNNLTGEFNVKYVGHRLYLLLIIVTTWL